MRSGQASRLARATRGARATPASTASTLDIQSFLLVVPVLLFSVIAHEYAHGYAALKQGDTTALALGRLTFNPIKHIDPFMTIILPAMLWIASGGRMVLGGAKPVPVDPRNYRNFRRGDIIVSLAGVFTNLLVAIACTLGFALFGLLGRSSPALEPTFGILQAMMAMGVELNLLLIAFNLIPIPPLDGSHVVKYLLPPSWSFRYQRIGFTGIALLLLVMWFVPGFLNWWLGPADVVARFLIGAVYGQTLPSTEQWLR